MAAGETIRGAGRKAELLGIQAGRAIAALLVVGFHTSISIFALRKYFSDQPFGRLFDFGHAGVNFFFVLSGFRYCAATAFRHHRDSF